MNPETMKIYKFVYIPKPAKCMCPARQQHRCEFKQNQEMILANDDIHAFHIFNERMWERKKKLKQVVSQLVSVDRMEDKGQLVP